MPPHCDSMSGPVVRAARQALKARNVNLVLPYVKSDGEEEVRIAFDKVLKARKQGGEAQEVAELYLYETVVRVHRAGEGAPFTGLKPAGADEGPVIPVAERAIETGSPEELLDLLADIVRTEVRERFDRMTALKKHAEGTVEEAREYVEAMLGLEVFAHKIYACAKAGPHEAHKQNGH